MNLSLLDAFGAAPAPSAPPPGAAALEGGTAEDGLQDSGFAALLDTAAGDPGIADADGASVTDADLATSAALDARLAAMLQSKWWLTAVSPEAQTSPATGRIDVDEDPVPADTAADPADEVAADWFIAAGADLTALVVEDTPAAAGCGGVTVAVGTGVDPGPSASDAEVTGESRPADAMANEENAGVGGSKGLPRVTAGGDVPDAARAVPAARQAPAMAAEGPAESNPPSPLVGKGDATPGGEPATEADAGVRSSASDTPVPEDRRSDRAEAKPAASTPPASPAELLATASNVARAIADLHDSARRGANPPALSAVDGQTRAAERRSSEAAARLANGIERGGGATAMAAGTVPAVSNSAATPADDPSQFDASTGDQSSGSPDPRFFRDAPQAPVRGAITAPIADPTAVSSVQPMPPPVSTAAMAPAASIPVPQAVTPGADTVPQLVQAMRLQVRAGGGEAVVRLNPEHLGEVSISLRVERGLVSATVNAESPVVRQWLEGQESSLREGLSGHGLHLERFVVQRDGRQAEQRKYEDQQPPRRRTPRRQPMTEQATFEVRV